MLALARVIIGLGGAFFLVLGVWLVVVGGVPFVGTVTALFGLGGLIVIGFERMRYRAEADEPDRPRPGSPGGLAPGERLDPRFKATGEVFLDPSTSRRMRVYLDPATGDRRYRPED